GARWSFRGALWALGRPGGGGGCPLLGCLGGGWSGRRARRSPTSVVGLLVGLRGAPRALRHARGTVASADQALESAAELSLNHAPSPPWRARGSSRLLSMTDRTESPVVRGSRLPRASRRVGRRCERPGQGSTS